MNISTIRKSEPLATVPELRAGDRLTRSEFERRYAAMPPTTKAELIEGVVYLPPPVSQDKHGGPHADVMTWLGVYRAAVPGVEAGDNSTLRLDMDNEPQPDGFLRILPDYGGQSRTVKGFIHGAPELLIEIAASSASYDLHDKLNVYRRNGVLEYVVWRVWDRIIDWFALRDGEYERLVLNAKKLYASEVFPGLWLDPAAMLRRDLRRVLQVLQRGISSRACSRFTARLQATKRKPNR